ncbi:MAG TPA: CDP-glucose 4,6-dehydratase [Clostridiales bacterium]|nr:CDP-glucose 4,6-dehydratase [Clostridiales bacterium]
MLKEFFNGKRVFITGHTGFKGTWMCMLLKSAGAELTGYALAPPTDPSVFRLANMEAGMTSVLSDIRDGRALRAAVQQAQPDIVIHMAAQPLVKESYEDPAYTYETNVMGTVHILEAVRGAKSVRSFVNVTTDKVYKNNEWAWGYRETDELNGHDPYSNSKSCSELVTDSYRKSFFSDRDIAVSTARAGNVIGGGDFAANRIVPDCARAAMQGREIGVRNPFSIRPYQHVLEPVYAYLEIARRQFEDAACAGNYNIGPDQKDCITTGELTTLFCKYWEGARWRNEAEENAVHEAGCLKLDCSKAKEALRIAPVWTVEMAIAKTVEWFRRYHDKGNVAALMQQQIDEYLEKTEHV